jgi:molecular chaperone GrpE
MSPDFNIPASDSQYAPTQEDSAASTDAALLNKELTEQKDRYLRLATDFENFKRRSRRDAEQAAAAEKEAFIRDLLPVLDNLERALAAGHASTSNALHQGVTNTLQQLGQLLNSNGIEAIEDVGRPFDPHRHEAVCIRHEPSQPDQIILHVMRRGYACGAQVFRPAQTIVNVLNPSPQVSYVG